jgi:hypothetical protein
LQRRRGYRMSLLFAAALAVTVARGDEPPSAASTKPAAANPSPATDANPPASGAEIKPELFYLRDKEGRLVPMPGFTYEDFVKYYRLKEQIERPEAKPRFNLEQLTIAGTAESDRVDLTVTVKVLLIDSDWARIPLRLNRYALREPAAYKGAGDQFLQFDPSGDGYVCWLRGAARSEHELVLKLAAPLATAAGESRLELALPRAAASKLTLHVPSVDPIVTSSAGSASPEVVADAKGSQLSVLGVGGDCWVAWRAPGQPPIRLSSALEAVGLVLVKIDGRSVSSEATLTVRSFGSEFDHFRVRLPPGAQLTGGGQPGYTLSPVGGAGAAVVDVKLDRKTTGPADVRLLTERAYDVTKRGETLELSGFSVSDAIAHRQWGHIAVIVSGDWQLVWGEPARARQVDELPEPLRRRDLTAGFEYFGQPASLPVRVVARKTRLSVDPQYTYRVGPDRVDLEARLKYTIRGARLFKLDLDLPDWEIDTVGPEDRIDANSIVSTSAGTITVPLLQPSTGELELNIKAHRRHPPGKKVIEWTLPEPHADVHGPADVYVIPAENVDLSPLSDKLIGLSPGIGGTLPADLSPAALSYRAEQGRARFGAEIAVHPQSVTVEADCQVKLGSRGIVISQVFDYRIRYEPLDRITLDVPRSLVDEQTLQVTVAGESVEAHEVGEPPSADRRFVELPLKPMMGSVKVEVHFQRPQPALSDSASTAIDIPLIVPTGTRVTANQATVTADPGIRIEQREGPWSVLDSPQTTPGPQTSLRFAAADVAPELRLAVAHDQRHSASATIIDRAWIQSWLSESVRQDRAIYNFTSDDNQISLTLPTGVSAGNIELSVDGRLVTPTQRSGGALAIPIPSEPAQHDHLLELRYQFDASGMHNGWLAFEVPRFDSNIRIHQTYWQLVLPQGEALVGGAGDLNPEYDWGWGHHGFGLERIPFKEQRQLEQWVGLSRQHSEGGASGAVLGVGSDEVPERTNRYLFSVVGPSEPFEVVVARRWLVLLLASFASLFAALAVIYVPALRQPRVLMAGACLLLLFVIIWPDPAILAAQAASLGFGLALLALVLRWLLGASGVRVPIARPDSSKLERSSWRIHKPLSDKNELVTSTASIAVGSGAESPGDRIERHSDSKQRLGGSTPGASAEL